MYHDDENEERLPIIKFLDGFEVEPYPVLALIVFFLFIFFAPSKQKDQPPAKLAVKKT